MSEIIEEDEFDVDFDDCDFDDCEEEYIEDKPKKKKGVTTDGLLRTLRSYFDNVEVDVKPFYEQLPKVIGHIGSISRHEYHDVICQDLAPKENKNPHIKYTTWVNLKIRNDHDFYTTMLKYIVDNYALLVKDEDMSFFKKSGLSEEGGLNYYLLYEDRKNNPIPSAEKLMKQRKEIIRHVFQDGVFENNNPRLEESDLSHYVLEQESGLEQFIDDNGGSLNDIELNRIFGMRMHFGIPVKDRYQRGDDSLNYPYWMDLCFWVSSFGKINDSSNCSTYSFNSDDVDVKGFTTWLREFTGIPKKEFNSVEEEIRKEILEMYKRHYELDEKSLEVIAKSCKNVKSFKKEIIGEKPDSNGGGCTGDLLSNHYNLTKKGLELTISAYKEIAYYIGWNLDDYTIDEDSDRIVLFDGDMYEYIYEYFNPPVESLSLFDSFEEESIDVEQTKKESIIEKVELTEPANNEDYSESVQLTFF